MRYVFVLLSLWIASTAVRAENRTATFEIPLKIHQAENYLADQRYRDADRLLTVVHESIKDSADDHPDRSMQVLDLLAKSRSQQGLHTTVQALLQERHQLIEKYFNEHGYVFAGSLGRLAEAHYRGDQKSEAIDLTEQAIDIYLQLRPVPNESLRVLKTNLAQYQIAPFSDAFLPLDLSEFYTRCERLAEPAFAVTADEYMHGFVEVYVDFKPAGEWRKFFNALKYANVKSFDGDAERRIFIPDQSITMLDEVCIVEESEGLVVNAMSVIE